MLKRPFLGMDILFHDRFVIHGITDIDVCVERDTLRCRIQIYKVRWYTFLTRIRVDSLDQKQYVNVRCAMAQKRIKAYT